jgi:hypothetical protein
MSNRIQRISRAAHVAMLLAFAVNAIVTLSYWAMTGETSGPVYSIALAVHIAVTAAIAIIHGIAIERAE